MDVESYSTLTYRIQTISENSKKIMSAILKINKDIISISHDESESELFCILFTDIIGASKLNEKFNLINGVHLLSDYPSVINYVPKISAYKNCCCSKKLHSIEKKRSIKQIMIFIEKEHQNELINILNNLALYNKPSKNEPIKKKLLAFVNPISGKGHSLKRWLEAKKVFDLGHVEIELVRTRYYRHAYDFVIALEENKVIY